MGQFGDTTLTKVFVGGLAWETQEKKLHEHFERFGEILEAAIIYDKLTGRSKGYGFVTFKETEAAKRACEDPNPVINGRRANCNIAALGMGARRGGRAPASAPMLQQQGSAGVMAMETAATPPPGGSNGQWYHPCLLPSAYPPQYHIPPLHVAYGYTPSFVSDMGYNSKVSPSMGGHYVQSNTSYTPRSGAVPPNGLFPMYHHYYYQQPPRALVLPPYHIPSSNTSPVAIVISKPSTVPQATAEHVTS